MTRSSKSLSPEHTPLMKQYLQFKQQVGEDVLLFFRVGDFYELFWEDARIVEKVLDLQVAQRGQSAGRPVEMSGVPWHSLDLHLSRLIRQGYKAAVVDQIGDPATSKGPVERALVRMITPGTLMDEALLDEKLDQPLIALYPFQNQVCLVGLTLSSGRAFFESLSFQELPGELARLSPSEILVPEHLALELHHLPRQPVITPKPSWHFDPQRGHQLLAQCLQTSSLLPFGIDPHQPQWAGILSSSAALLEHARQSLGHKNPHCIEFQPILRESLLNIDPSTRLSLDLIAHAHALNSTPTLFSTLDRCVTSMGSRLLQQWILSPLLNPQALEDRYDSVSWLLQSNLSADIQNHLDRLCDIERAASRFATLQSRPKDFSQLRQALHQIPQALDLLKNHSVDHPLSSLLQDLLEQARLPDDLADLLTRAIAPQPSLFIRDGQVIADGYHAELDQLRQLSVDAQAEMEAFERQEREVTQIPNLKIDFNRVQGFSIEISKTQIDKVPSHYQRKSTLKNAERYTTPELQAFETRVLSAKEQSLILEKQIFETLQKTLQGYARDLTRVASAISSLDVLCTFALLSRDRHYCRPQICITIPEMDSSSRILQTSGIQTSSCTSDQASFIHAYSMRHPVVEMIPDLHFIANDAFLNPQSRIALLTGPNMGGKSTYMRSIALCLIMAQSGCFVPCSQFQFFPFDRLFARIGAHDDLAQGQSTFMVEMLEASAILHQSGNRSLCLIDEIGRGTSTFDGLSLAWAIFKHLHDHNQSCCIFSTHYFELSERSESLPGAYRIHMSAALGSQGLTFLHEIHPGSAHQSYGLEVARLAGIPSAALEVARQCLAEHQAPPIPSFSPACHESSNTLTPFAQSLYDSFQTLNLDTLTPRQALEWIWQQHDRHSAS